MFGNVRDMTEDFLRYLRVQRGRTKQTVRNYQLYLARFLAWLEEAGERVRKPKDMSPELMARYRQYLAKLELKPRGKLSTLTQNYHLIALRSFLRYLKEKGVNSVAPSDIPLMRNWQRKLTLLSREELARLLGAPEKLNRDRTVGLRDRALMELMVASGLTVSEVAALTVAEVRGDDELTIQGARGRKRTVKLPPSCRQFIQAYLVSRGEVPGPLFLRHDRARHGSTHEPLTPRSIQRSLERYRKACGITAKVTPFTLRHAYARSLLASGEPLEHVQELLGHKHKNTTRVYRFIDQEPKTS